MPERQLDVFARSGIDAASAKTTGVQWRHVAASERDDHVLIPMLPTLWAEGGSPQPVRIPMISLGHSEIMSLAVPT